MKKSIALSACLACLIFSNTCNASYTESMVGKYFDSNIKIEYLLTVTDNQNVFHTIMNNKKSAWTGSKDESLRPSAVGKDARRGNTERAQRPSNSPDKTAQIATGLNVLNSPNPRYIKKKYIVTKYNGGLSYKHDYPVYINDDLPEMGVDFYIYEQDDAKLEELREQIRNVGNPKMQKGLAAYKAIATYLSGSSTNEYSDDLNIVYNNKIYFLNRVNKSGTWAAIGEIDRSKALFKLIDNGNTVDSLGDFNAVKDLLCANRSSMDIKVLETVNVKIDEDVFVKEKVEIQRLSEYGHEIGKKLTVDLLYSNGELAYFTFPTYDKNDIFGDFKNYIVKYRYNNALFKIEKTTSVFDNSDFENINKFKLERLAMGW